MQSVSSRIWTRVAVSISYADNHYTTGVTTQLSLVVWIFDTKLVDFYRSVISDYYFHLYCYIHNISADMFSGLL